MSQLLAVAQTAGLARPRVLVVAHTTTFLTELSLFGELLRNRTDYEVAYHCAFIHRTANQYADNCVAGGVICLVDPLSQSLGWSGVWVKTLALIRRAANRAIGFRSIAAGFVAEQILFLLRRAEIKALLARFTPRLLVLGGDMPDYDTSLFVKLAHGLKIPVLVVPSTMSNGLEQAEVYSGDPRYYVDGWARRAIAARFPNWVRRHNGRSLFRCPPGRLLAMESLGIAPPQPWIFNSGSVDAVAMESEAMIDYYVKEGLKPENMVLTGSLTDDVLAACRTDADRLRRAFCQEFGFDPERPLIVTALPPDFFYLTGGRPQCDFRTYQDLIEFWIDTLADLKECNCLVSLHPSVNVETMRWIERPTIRIASSKTAKLVPLCDIYVASVSSTIRWAIACGKPVVNYDVYRYRYTDFRDVPGVLATEEQREFRAILDHLVADRPHRDKVAREQDGVAGRWGLLDGHAGDRMLALVKRLSGVVTVPAIRTNAASADAIVAQAR